MTIDYEEARRVVARALASGAISVATAPTPARKKRALEAKPRKRVVREKRMCPRCERMVLAVNGRVIKHREREDRRGYGNGAWCSFNEVDTENRDGENKSLRKKTP